MSTGRPLHLHHDRLARAQPGSVDLGDGGGGEGLAVEPLERGLDGPAELGLDDSSDRRERLGRHLVAAQLELPDQLLREQPLAGRDDLPELDVRRAQVLGRLADSASTRRRGSRAASAKRPRRFFTSHGPRAAAKRVETRTKRAPGGTRPGVVSPGTASRAPARKPGTRARHGIASRCRTQGGSSLKAPQAQSSTGIVSLVATSIGPMIPRARGPADAAGLGAAAVVSAEVTGGRRREGHVMGDGWIAQTSLSTRFPIYTRANVGEVFPDPVTPLTLDVGIALAEWGWRDGLVRIGTMDYEEFDANAPETLGVAGGYCYLNASLMRLFGERAPGLSWEMIDQQFYGAQPGIPPYEEQPGDIRPDLTEKIGATFGWALGVTELPDLVDDQRLTIDLRAKRPDLARLTDRELLDRFLGLFDRHFRHLFAQHLFVTSLASVPVGILSGVTAAIGQPAALLDLIAGLGDVDSAAPSFAFWDLGRIVAGAPEVAAAFDEGIDGVLGRLQALDTQASVALLAGLDDFQRQFGSRGPNEWEVRSPTWETRPELALAAIDRMRLAPEEVSPTAQNAARAQVREATAAAIADALAVDPEVQGQFLAGVHAATVWLPARERTKTNAIRLIHEGRMALRELGRRMVERGVFDEVEDFGFLVRAELEALCDGGPPPTDTVRSRRASYEALGRLEPPFVFVGQPPPVDEWEERGSRHAPLMASGEVLAGLPACPGTAEGVARVVLDAADPLALEPGDVLVAPITDPSWTPLFVPAAAVVVDVGALQSHAVIVSRELGIPCVVSATGATQRIPSGARVRVDGTAGTITIL